VLSGPISEVLLPAPRLEGNDGYGYETRYGKLIVFTVVSAACGLVCFGVRRRR